MSDGQKDRAGSADLVFEVCGSYLNEPRTWPSGSRYSLRQPRHSYAVAGWCSDGRGDGEVRLAVHWDVHCFLAVNIHLAS